MIWSLNWWYMRTALPTSDEVHATHAADSFTGALCTRGWYQSPSLTMLSCLHLQQNLTSRSALHSPRLPRFHHRPLALLSSFLFILTGVHARRGPTFDTDTISNPTPCNPVTFSWTGGVSPFALAIFNDDTGNTVAEFDVIEDNFVTWTPPLRIVDKPLYAEVVDDDNISDETDDFVVQPASCFSVASSTPPTSTVSSEPLPTTFPPTSSQTVSPVPPTESSTSLTKTPPPFTPPSTHLPQSTLGSPSSSSSPSLHGTSNTGTSQLGNSTTSSTPTTGIASATGGSTSSPSPTTSAMHWQSSASRPHRKSSVSAGEIAGIVLGAVALLCMLVALVVWRWAARRTMHDTRPEDDNYAALQSSLSTQHETSLSSKAAIRRHAYSVASPTTPAGIGAAASLLHGGVLHVYDRHLTANSVAVEPPTPPMSDHPLVLPPLPAHASEMKARGGGNTTEVVATEPRPEVSPAAGTEARGGVQARDQLGTTPEPSHDVDLDGKLQGDGRGSGRPPGARFTLVESDGGVRLAGGPLGLLDDSEGLITRLPPPYHHYDS